MQDDKSLNQDSITVHGLIARLKQVAWVLLITLVLAEVLARAIFVLAKPEATYHKEYDRRLAMVQKAPTDDEQAQTQGNTVFLMGDSRMMVGGYADLMATRLAQAHLPVLVRNTSVSGGTPRMNLFMLKQAMEKGYKPKLILYTAEDLFIPKVEAASALVSTPEPKLANSYVGRCLYNPPQSVYGRFVCGLERFSYFARGRRYFKQYLGLWDLALLQPQKYQQVPYDLNTPDWEISPMGWAPGYRILNPATAAKAFRPSEKSLLDKANAQGQEQWVDNDWHEFFAYTQSQKIPVTLVWIPEYQTPALKQNAHVQHRYKLIQQQFKAYAQRYNNVRLINLLTSDTDASHFYNRNHLNVLGAVTLTTKLSQALTKAPYRAYIQPQKGNP